MSGPVKAQAEAEAAAAETVTETGSPGAGSAGAAGGGLGNAATLKALEEDELSFEYEGAPRTFSAVSRAPHRRALARGEMPTLAEELRSDIDEPQAVGQKKSRSKQYRYATSAFERQLLDSLTNRITKHTRTEVPGGGRPRGHGPQGTVSVIFEPEALFTHRFSAILEMRAIFRVALLRYGRDRTKRPTEIKAAINAEIRRILKEGRGQAATRVRAALALQGWNPDLTPRRNVRVTLIDQRRGPVSETGQVTTEDLGGSGQEVETQKTTRVLGVVTGREAGKVRTDRDVMADALVAHAALLRQIARDRERLAALAGKTDEESMREAAVLRAAVPRRQKDLLDLEAPPQPAVVDRVVRDNDLDVEQARRTVSGKTERVRLRPGGRTREEETTGYTVVRTGDRYAQVVHGEKSTRTIGPGGYIAEDESHRVTDQGTRRTSRSAKTTTRVATGEDVLSGERRVETSTAEVGGERSSTVAERKIGVTAGEGRLSVGAESKRETQRTDAAGRKSGSSSSASASGGLLHTEAGTGIGVKGGAAVSDTEGGVKRGLHVSGDGSYTVNVELLGEHPMRYQVTTLLHLGVGFGRSRESVAAQPEGGTASASIGGKVGADLKYVKVLDERQARLYLGDLERLASGQTADGRPEYGIVARLHATRAGIGDPLALVSGSAARSLADGESMSLDLTSGVDVGVSGRAKGETGGSVTAGLGSSGGRRITVARKGAVVKVTIAIRGERHGSAGADVTVLKLAQFGGSITRSQGDSLEYGFKLDPAQPAVFDRQFSELRAIGTAEELGAFAKDHPSLVDARVVRSTSESGHTAKGGVAGAALEVGVSGKREQKTGFHAKGLFGTATGEQTSTAGLSLGGVTVAQGGTTAGITAGVSKEGTFSADLSRTEKSTDAGLALADARRRFATRDVADSALDVAVNRPSGILKEYLRKTFDRLTNYHLGEEHFQALLVRAEDERNWGHAARSPRIVAPWRRLRYALLAPEPEQEWLRHDPTPDHWQANQLARANALAAFMEENGDLGFQAVENVLRRYGEAGLSTRFSRAADLGELAEWPPALMDTHTRYEQLKEQTDELAEHFATLGAGPEAAREIGRRASLLRADLDRVVAEVSASTDFRKPRAKLEMLRDIQGLAAKVSRTSGEAQARALGQSVPAEPAAGGAPPAEQAGAIELRLRVAKSEERRLMQAARALLPKSAGGQLGEHWYDVFREDADRAARIAVEAGELLKPWIADIKDLRQAYRAARTDPAAWLVRPSASDRPRDLDPDIAGLLTLHHAARHASLHAMVGGGWEDAEARWRELSAY